MNEWMNEGRKEGRAVHGDLERCWGKADRGKWCWVPSSNIWSPSLRLALIFGLWLRKCFSNWGLSCFRMNFRIICSSSMKNVMGILIGIALNLQIALGSMAILTIVILFFFKAFLHDTSNIIFFNFIYLFIYLWLCWVFISVLGLSLVVASGGHSSLRCAGLSLSRPLVAEHRLQTCRLSNCGSRAQLLRGMWDLPRPGLEAVSPSLAGRFSTTAPPGKPCPSFYM